MKISIACFVGIILSLVLPELVVAQDGTSVQPPAVAKTLAELEAQLRSWQKQYNLIVTNDGINPATLLKILKLNLTQGDIVGRGLVQLQDSWNNDVSKKERESKYPAILAMFWNPYENRLHPFRWTETLGSPLDATDDTMKKLGIVLKKDPMGGSPGHDYFYNELSKREQNKLSSDLATVLATFISSKGFDIAPEEVASSVSWYMAGYGGGQINFYDNNPKDPNSRINMLMNTVAEVYALGTKQ